MAQPVMLSVDDDPGVSRAIARDLRQRYGSTYRVRRAESGTDALTALRELALRNERVGLLLADQRMPNMDGVQFLREARGIYPSARRVLLTAYADTEAAIAAINEADVHYFLLKPWDPPEDRLYPVIDALLEDWVAEEPPSFDGVRVVATASRPGPTRSRTSWPATRCRSGGTTWRATARLPGCSPRWGRAPTACPSWSPPTGRRFRLPRPPTWPAPSG